MDQLGQRSAERWPFYLRIGRAQRCAAVAAGQSQRAKPAQGRADLRAAEHSGGQLAGRGPQKK